LELNKLFFLLVASVTQNFPTHLLFPGMNVIFSGQEIYRGEAVVVAEF